jgi:zinc transport system ATP-binding protein
LRPWRGTALIDGQPVNEMRHRIGYVPQWIEFDPEFPVRVRDVVRMGRLAQTRLFRRYSRADDAIVDRVLGEMDLQGLADMPMGELSGGQRQRTLIARALAVEPTLLLLDEPTANVDTRISAAVYELLARLNERMTILLVTHDMGVISARVKSVGCLNRRLHYHGGRDLSRQVLEETYQCPIDLIAHGVPHRVFPAHGPGGEAQGD